MHGGLLWLVCGFVLLVLACVHCPLVGGGCGCVFGVGHESCSEQTRCRVHVQHRVGVHLLWWLACMTRLGGLFLGVVVCGGLFVICIVVASIFVLYCFLCFV